MKRVRRRLLPLLKPQLLELGADDEATVPGGGVPGVVVLVVVLRRVEHPQRLDLGHDGVVELPRRLDCAEGLPRRVTLGLEQNRLSMLLAVLHRHCGIAMFDQDVYVNVVGGVRITETAADLPVLLAVLSSFRDRPIPRDLVAFGEVGLAGEIRPVPSGQERLKEAAKHGFKRAIVPRKNAPKKSIEGLQVIAVDRLSEVLDAI